MSGDQGLPTLLSSDQSLHVWGPSRPCAPAQWEDDKLFRKPAYMEYIQLEFCKRTAPIAKSLASHMSSKGISQSGAIKIEASNKQFFGHVKEDPHAHVRYFNKITPTLKFLNDDLVLKFINQFFLPSKTTNLRNEITNIQQRFDESFSEAWDRFKYLLRACPHHGFSELHQLDTFYNALNSKDQNSLNSAGGGNFLDKMPRECLTIIESKYKDRYSRNKPIVAKVSTNTSTSGISPDVAELKDMVKALLLDKKGQNQSPAPVKAVEESCVTYGGAHSYRNCPATDGNVYHDNIQEFVSQASADNYNQGNTNYRPSMMSNQIRPPVNPTNNESTEGVQPQVVQSESLVLTSEPVTSQISEPVIAPKLPEKLGDPGKFLIPCDFLGMVECLALADLGASINLMPFSVWKTLFLPDLTPTCMSLELADRSISRPAGVAEDVYVKVDFDADPQVPLILGRSFLKTGRSLIDVFEGELTLRVGKEAINFNLDQTSRYSANYSDMTAKRIDVIDMAYEEYSQEVDAFLAIEDDPTSPEFYQPYLDPKRDIILLEAFLNDDPSLPPPTQGNYLPEVRKELKICEAKSNKFLIDEPPEVELKDLPPHLEYEFLEVDDKLPVIIAKDLSVEEKTALITVLKSHKKPSLGNSLISRRNIAKIIKGRCRVTHMRTIAGISLVVVNCGGLRDKFMNVVTINIAIGGWTIT
nr:reverse transcriptase domain-containing protein [Tanacetum cinerariifolium]